MRREKENYLEEQARWGRNGAVLVGSIAVGVGLSEQSPRAIILGGAFLAGSLGYEVARRLLGVARASDPVSDQPNQ